MTESGSPKSPDDIEAALTDARQKHLVGAGMTAVREAMQNVIAFTPKDIKLAALEKNDFGNGKRLLERFGDQILHVKDVGWHGWTKKHWSREVGDVMAEKLADETHTMIFAEAKAVASIPHKDRLHINAEDHERWVDDLLAWARQSGDIRRRESMLRNATTYRTVMVPELDVDLFLFNCDNCTLDLRDPAKIKRRSHNPADLITRISPVRYDQKATCDLWRAFLNRVLPDVEVQQFLQQYAGYALTGDTSAQALVLMWGGGANGKSTFNEAIRFVLGDYGEAVAFETLVYDRNRSGSSPSPDIARLRGIRAAFASEPEQSAQLSEGLIKHLTGGEEITARFLNRDPFRFKPQFKLFLSFNPKPKIRGTDNGIWRRLHLVPFTVTIPLEERDGDLLEKLKGEASGILNWMIEGYIAWRAAGKLIAPAAVRAATEEYRQESDNVGQFVEDVLVEEAGARETPADLFKAYKRWCGLNAKFPMGETLFGTRMGERYTKIKSHGVRYYTGVKLMDDWRSGGAAHGDATSSAPPPQPGDPGHPDVDDEGWPTGL